LDGTSVVELKLRVTASVEAFVQGGCQGSVGHVELPCVGIANIHNGSANAWARVAPRMTRTRITRSGTTAATKELS